MTATGAVLGWTTNEASDSQADYGLTTSYGSVTALDPTLVTAHTRTLSGLQPNTLYHFRVRSRDAAANLAVSGDVTFRTLAAPDTTPPVITGVGASSVTTTGAVVRWTTNEASDSQADYGLTTAYGSVTALDATLVTAHARTLSGLQPNTLYHFRVRSRDAARNLAISGDVTFRTLAVADTTPPTVSFTAPAAGAVVSASITVAANASDNVGVAGVRFFLDGVALGAEDTIAPYSIAWNTRTATNGAHTLSALARDAAGRTATATRPVTVSNVADTIRPTVYFTAPAAGASVSASVTVSANAADNVGVVGVQVSPGWHPARPRRPHRPLLRRLGHTDSHERSARSQRGGARRRRQHRERRPRGDGRERRRQWAGGADLDLDREGDRNRQHTQEDGRLRRLRGCGCVFRPRPSPPETDTWR